MFFKNWNTTWGNFLLQQSEKLTQIKEALPSALPTKEGTDDSVENNGAHGSLQVNGTTVPKTVSESKTDTQPPEQVDSSDRQSTEVDMEKGEEQNVTKPEQTDQGSVGEGSSKGQETSSSGKEENKSSDDRNEEEMEVSQAGEPSSDTLPKETVTSRVGFSPPTGIHSCGTFTLCVNNSSKSCSGYSVLFLVNFLSQARCL